MRHPEGVPLANCVEIPFMFDKMQQPIGIVCDGRIFVSFDNAEVLEFNHGFFLRSSAALISASSQPYG